MFLYSDKIFPRLQIYCIKSELPVKVVRGYSSVLNNHWELDEPPYSRSRLTFCKPLRVTSIRGLLKNIFVTCRGVTLDRVLDWILDLLTTYIHNS
jgi:hypothetical protein